MKEYTSKLESEAKAEAHKNYIDIQYIVSGTEVIEGFDISYATPKSEYNDVKDVMFYEDFTNADKGILNANEYGIFCHWIRDFGLLFVLLPPTFPQTRNCSWGHRIHYSVRAYRFFINKTRTFVSKFS